MPTSSDGALAPSSPEPPMPALPSSVTSLTRALSLRDAVRAAAFWASIALPCVHVPLFLGVGLSESTTDRFQSARY